jgi:predicted ATPase
MTAGLFSASVVSGSASKVNVEIADSAYLPADTAFKNLVEPLTGHEIPVTLHDSLMARLDRLGAAKAVAQVGAVIGSEFSYELLHAVHPFSEEDLQGALRKLADAELIYVRGIPPEASYTFKHALIRDAAYEALLRSRRKELHRLVAHTIDEKFTALNEEHLKVLSGGGESCTVPR